MAYKFKGPIENYLSHITCDVLKEIYENHGFEVELKKEVYHDASFLAEQLSFNEDSLDEYLTQVQESSVGLLDTFTCNNYQKKRSESTPQNRAAFTSVVLPPYERMPVKRVSAFEIYKQTISRDYYEVVDQPGLIEIELVRG